MAFFAILCYTKPLLNSDMGRDDSMREGNVTFSETDFKILNSYKSVLDGLAAYWGDGYEMVLHSLHDLDHSVIKIINGHYTGRREGFPITDLALSMLAKIREQPDTNCITYFNRNQKGEPLKSATIVIRGEHQKVIGLLCINFYMNTPLANVLSAFLPPAAAAQEPPVEESYVEDVEDLIAQAVAEASQRVQQDSSISNTNKNKEIVSILQQKGIFNLKDAVVKVADHMGISKNTVYMHVRNLNHG